MIPYNVDFFDFDLNYLHSEILNEIDLDDDYLSPSSNSISIRKTSKIKTRDLLYINELNYLGLITEISDSEEETTVSYSSIWSLFDHDIAFNIGFQNTYPLEQTIKSYMSLYWGSEFSAMKIESGADITSWNFGIDADNEEEGTLSIINLYSDLIANGISKCGMSIAYDVNINNKLVTFKIYIPQRIDADSYNMYIDADSYNVEIDGFTLCDISSETNRLYLHNSANPWSEQTTIYLHPDYTYDTSTSNIIFPAVIEVQSVSTSDDKSFEQACSEAADSVFGALEWSNLIELNMRIDDPLIRPLQIPVGQRVQIVHDNLAHTSILTQKSISSEYIRLSFGTVRLDLTKKLRSKI